MCVSILLALDATAVTYMKNSASMEEAESLANFSMLTELDANGATKEDLDNMRGVLQSQVDEKMPWLSDVLGVQFDKLVSSSSDSDD